MTEKQSKSQTSQGEQENNQVDNFKQRSGAQTLPSSLDYPKNHFEKNKISFGYAERQPIQEEQVNANEQEMMQQSAVFSHSTNQNIVFQDSHEDKESRSSFRRYSSQPIIQADSNGAFNSKSIPLQMKENAKYIGYNDKIQFNQPQLANQGLGTRENSDKKEFFKSINQLSYKKDVYQQCPTHPRYAITNICVAETCIEPLCPECVKIHSYMHNEKSSVACIDTILFKKQNCIDYLSELREKCTSEQTLLTKISDIQKGDVFSNCLQAIQNAKQLIFNNINAFFYTFELQVKQKINQIKASQPNIFNSINQKITFMLGQIQDFQNKLDSSSYVKYIIQILSDEFDVDFNSVQKEVDSGIETYLNQLFHVTVKDNLINDIQNLLVKSVNMEKFDLSEFKWRDNSSEISKQMPPQKNKEKNNKERYQLNKQISQNPFKQSTLNNNNLTKINGVDSYKENDLNKISTGNGDKTDKGLQEQIKQLSRFTTSMRDLSCKIQPQSNTGDERVEQKDDLNKSVHLDQDKQVIKIDTFDYFTPECQLNIMHFFQDNSKQFHFLDLSQITYDPQSQQWKTVELKINFKIPMFHRSIITPDGKVYMCGGINVLKKNKSVDDTYFLDMNSNSLQLCSHMNVERSSHSLVFSQDSIFAVGGQNSDGEEVYLTSCERFDVDSLKWVIIADMHEGVSGASLSNFNDKYIYRFGGRTYLGEQSSLIERYNILNNIWDIISFSQNEQIPSFGGGCQINANEMIILGGQIGDTNLKQSLIARVNDSLGERIILSQANPMPVAGSFWQNPIIGGNVLFAMQNVKLENSKMNSFSKKSMLVFNSRIWRELGQ